MPSSAHYTPTSQIAYDQLAATYLCFGVMEALVLRCTHDMKVWRAVVFALFLCDLGTGYAAWAEMGTREFWCPWVWEGRDGVMMGMNWVPLVVRAAFLLGIGIPGLNREEMGIPGEADCTGTGAEDVRF